MTNGSTALAWRYQIVLVLVRQAYTAGGEVFANNQVLTQLFLHVVRGGSLVILCREKTKSSNKTLQTHEFCQFIINNNNLLLVLHRVQPIVNKLVKVPRCGFDFLLKDLRGFLIALAQMQLVHQVLDVLIVA